MSNPFAGNAPLNPQQVNRFANKANTDASPFSVTSTTSVTVDSGPYINNKVIQVNAFAGSLTVQISLDGKEFFPGPAIAATGIYPIALPCKFILFTSTGNCSGLVLSSL
jgi:hypothetical protein